MFNSRLQKLPASAFTESRPAVGIPLLMSLPHIGYDMKYLFATEVALVCMALAMLFDGRF